MPYVRAGYASASSPWYSATNSCPQRLGQRLQHRAGSGAGDPLEHRVPASRPGVSTCSVESSSHGVVQPRATRGQQDHPGRLPRREPAGHSTVGEMGREAADHRRAGAAADGWVRRSCRAPGRPASRRERAHRQAGQQVAVTGHPLQRRIAEHHVRPARPVASRAGRPREAQPRARVRAGLGDHLRRGVEADDAGLRPALGERRGELAGSAPQVDHRWPGVLRSTRRTRSKNGRDRSSANCR